MAYQSTAGDPANFNNTYDGANILRTIAEALGLNTSGLGRSRHASSEMLPREAAAVREESRLAR